MLHHALPSFEEYLLKIRNYSGYTIRNYMCAVESFYTFSLEEEFELENATQVEVRTWLELLFDEKLKPQSINLKLSALRTFYDFCCLYLGWCYNPAVQIRNLKTTKNLPKFVSAENLNYIIDNVLKTDTWQQRRAKAILLFLFHTGTRCSEACNAKVADIDFERKSIRVIGKGKRERLIPIGQELIACLCNIMIEDDLCTTDPLFRTDKGQQLEPWQLRLIVKNALSCSLPAELCHPHVLRHSFASALLNAGAGIEYIRQLLGHAHVSTTQIYTHTDFTALSNAYSKCFKR